MRGENAAGKAGILVRVDDAGFEEGFQSPEVGGIVLAIEDYGTC